MVLDFRALNDKIIGDTYPLPNIVDILDQLGAQYFSVCDLASGFHQIKMDPTDSHKTAFTTPFGHYEFDRMPFGLKRYFPTINEFSIIRIARRRIICLYGRYCHLRYFIRRTHEKI